VQSLYLPEYPLHQSGRREREGKDQRSRSFPRAISPAATEREAHGAGTHIAKNVQVNRPWFPSQMTMDKETNMNWDRIEGNWKQAKGKIKEQWGRLTDDDLNIIDGKREQLAGKIQHAYGVSKDEAEKQLSRFESHYHD
jgi:uncharacterized protein YjbJ (UPF0337 family)